MAFAILRTEKLKTAASIRGAGGHNARTRETPNADPNHRKKNQSIIDGGPDLYRTVIKEIEGAGARYRSNSVLAQEVFLSASPEYFRVDPSMAGTWEENKMETWRDASVLWLQQQFGDKIVDCQLHLDESTPHIHAIVVPLTEDSRLSARDIFNRNTLRDMQTTYAKSLEQLGLKRGLHGSKAEHTTIKQFYTAANRSDQAKIPKVTKPGTMLLQRQRQDYADHINQALDRKLKPVFKRANSAVLANKKKREYQLSASSISEENLQLKKQIKAAAETARSTPLRVVLQCAGLEQDPKDPKQWIGSGHRITIKNQKFYDHVKSQGGGGAIDLVKHLNPDYDFRQAVAWLGQEIDPVEAAKTIRAEAKHIAKQLSHETDLSFQPPKPYPDKLQELKKYLTEERKLDPQLTNPLIKAGKIYATVNKGHVNAVFIMENANGPTGAEIKGLKKINGKGFWGTASGSKRKKGAFVIGEGDSKHAVFVESAIDAIAYKQLHPDPCYVISTAGATTAPAFVRDLQAKGWKMTVAYDNDETGQAFVPKFLKEFPDAQVHTPRTKDWNDDLITEPAWLAHQKRPALTLAQRMNFEGKDFGQITNEIRKRLVNEGWQFETATAYANLTACEAVIGMDPQETFNLAVNIQDTEENIRKRKQKKASFEYRCPSYVPVSSGEIVMQASGSSSYSGKTEYQILVDRWEAEIRSIKNRALNSSHLRIR